MIKAKIVGSIHSSPQILSDCSIYETLHVQSIAIKPNPDRVIAQAFLPSHGENKLYKVLQYNETVINSLLHNKINIFSKRHQNIWKIIRDNYEEARRFYNFSEEELNKLSQAAKDLLGCIYTKEYTPEGASKFNPSIVIHPDQSNVEKGMVRVILSFRATGEGHVSSIVFHPAIVDEQGRIILDTPSNQIETPDKSYPEYDRNTLILKLREIGIYNRYIQDFTNQLPESINRDLLLKIINHAVFTPGISKKNITRLDRLLNLAESNFILKFNETLPISSLVIFPSTSRDSHGLEDSRWVRFIDDEGKTTYYATYTAYNGTSILPQLIETTDFKTFNMVTLNGDTVEDKNLALFPKKINGKYAMLSRNDGENLYIMFSDNIHFWHEKTKIELPNLPWLLMQTGACAPPIETDEGWLVVIHGVETFREYSIGAILFDKDDPSKVKKITEFPVLNTNVYGRGGYVPNVVYTCGALVFNKRLVIPFAVGDSYNRVCSLSIDELLQNMVAPDSPEIRAYYR
ncbi:MAG: glycosidase [Candidatus Margulisiibacteriota bacterium]